MRHHTSMSDEESFLKALADEGKTFAPESAAYDKATITTACTL